MDVQLDSVYEQIKSLMGANLMKLLKYMCIVAVYLNTVQSGGRWAGGRLGVIMTNYLRCVVIIVMLTLYSQNLASRVHRRDIQ